MDYVVGSVAALISGNLTPNRPKLIRRALTPTKHQPSPNVTPKSEFVEDRSIFLSPTQQKKKAIVKKSPKRIFQNPDLDVTEDCEGNSALTSPKAEKVKKHLKDELEAENMGKKKSKPPNSTLDKSTDDVSPTKKSKIVTDSNVTDGTPKKKKNKKNSESNDTVNDNSTLDSVNTSDTTNNQTKSPKNKHRKSISEEADKSQTNSIAYIQEKSSDNVNTSKESANKDETKKNKKQKKKRKKSQAIVESTTEDKENNQTSTDTVQNVNKKKKKKNKKNKTQNTESTKSSIEQKEEETEVENQENNSESDSEEVKSGNIPNPNAITEKDSDSEHDSDDEIESENEEANEKVLTNENTPESSDEEEEDSKSNNNNNKNKQKEKGKEEKGQQVMTEDEVKRTLFVGNVPFSKKCKKEIKKIFSKHGQIETIRIRTIPVKDGRVTPKLAIIKNELHPERSTVNVYIKYAEPASVGRAITENNTVLNGNHLRVSRSDSTGTEHDPRCAVFIGNLPFAVEDDVLRSKFDKCGEIVSVRIIRDKKTNAGKGFGYINFASKDGVELALALSEEDLTMKNRILRVKRCTQTLGKQGKLDQGKQGYQGGRMGNHAGRLGYQGGKPGQGVRNRGGWQGNQGGRPGYQGGRQGDQGGRPGYQGGRQGYQGGRQGDQGGRQGDQGDRQGDQGGRVGQGGGGKWGQQAGKWGEQGQDGAARRLMNKRKFQESSGGEGPPNKRQTVNQPAKEKKPRKEFVGMTADKKKKHKFDKGLKKKKALSEILTKKS